MRRNFTETSFFVCIGTREIAIPYLVVVRLDDGFEAAALVDLVTFNEEEDNILAAGVEVSPILYVSLYHCRLV